MPSNNIRSQIELVWEEFWRAGLFDSVEIMEQMLYLLFLRRLDDVQSHAAAGGSHARRWTCWSPAGEGDHLLRWSSFKQLGDAAMFELLSEHVFPRLRRLGGPGSAYAQHLKDARFTIPTAVVLSKVVKLIEALPRPSDAGAEDPYDYLSDKLARLGRRGDFYIPRHIDRLMVALVAPQPGDIVCCPVSGTGHLLVATGEYLARRHPALLEDPTASEHFHHRMFHAYDADKTMLRIACMNMLLHGVKNPNIRYTNSIAPDIGGDEDRYSLVLAHPSTTSLPAEDAAGRHEDAEVLMVTQFLRLLKPGGRAAVIVPRHILRGTSQAQLDLCRMLVQEQRLDALIALPCGPFDADAHAAKAILLFTRTDCGGSGCCAARLARRANAAASSVAQPTAQHCIHRRRGPRCAR